MSWDARQTAMLAAMGLRVWPRGEALPPAEPPAEAGQAETAARPAPVAARPAPVPVPVPAPPQQVLRAAAALLPKAGELAQTAGLDWVELAHAAAECRACRLCEGRRGQVFGAGAQRADWLLLADPSSETEDAAAAQPFSGAAGLLLGQMLRALRLDPAPALGQAPAPGDADPARQAYITQPLKCRAGLNSRPAAEELQRCAPLLQRQIELLRPRVIVALGRQSAQALLASDEPLGRLRGRLHEAGGVPVVVSYSLDFLLRNAEHKAQAWQDLALAWQASRQPAAT